MQIPFRSVPWLVALPAVVSACLIACGSEGGADDNSGGLGAGGSAGAGSGAGGDTAGGTSGSGTAGSSGVSGSGAQGGNPAAGGTGDAGSGAGGARAGGGGMGGNAMGGMGGSSGDAGGEAGAAGDAGSGGQGGSGSDPGETLDSCFEGLRQLEGTTQLSTRENAAEQIRLRVALETADRFGTSGTYPWDVVRIALEIDGSVICLKEDALTGVYTGSHHNCSDRLEFGYSGNLYEITRPDVSAADSASVLRVTLGPMVLRGPVTLTTTECVASGGPSQMCRSGGPC